MKLPVLPNPWLIVGVLILVISAFGYGWKIGKDVADGEHARVELIARVVEKAAERGAANATIKVETRHETIYNRAKEIIREVPVCHNPDSMQRVLDDARANRPSDPGGDRELPAGTPAR